MKLILLFIFLSFASAAQVPAKEPETAFIDPEEMPQFKGGNSALMRYLQDSVKSKAMVSLEESYVLQRAYARFTISETGKVGHVHIIRSSRLPRIDSLFKSAIEHMPDWSPGSFKGKPKAVQMNLPLKLELE